jgi:hypothetical protein
MLMKQELHHALRSHTAHLQIALPRPHNTLLSVHDVTRHMCVKKGPQ